LSRIIGNELLMSTYTISASPQACASEGFRVRLLSDAPGLVEMKAQPNAIVSVHLGPSSRMLCCHGNQPHYGTAIHGDVEIIPWGISGSWELKERDAAFVMMIAPGLLLTAAQDLGADSSEIELRSRFHVRDLQIEHIAGALKSEMEQGNPSGHLYRDSLAMALAVHLVRNHSSLSRPAVRTNGKMSPGKLKQVLLFIEDHLPQNLSLADVARAAGISVSHCNVLFRESTGLSIHQYVIRRRVERAAWMLQEGRSPISQVALETGFAHQSHLAMHMRRIIGTSPRKLRAYRHSISGRR
jgi:AraC family transcriptional regulator